MESAESMVGITVFFDEGIAQERIEEIKEEIRLRVEVSDIVYISADEAWEKYKEENLSEELIETFGKDNPLENSASLEVYLNDVSMQKALVNKVESLEGVRKVNHSDSVAESFAGIKALVFTISISLIAILVAVAVFLIRTTISTGVNVRREEIFIMSIFGATDFFIRAPFVVEGLLIGLLGSVLPMGILYVAYGEVVETLKMQFQDVFTTMKFLDRIQMMKQFIPLALVFSLSIGLIASHFTAKKQIRKIEMQH
jgi:cell division transport system permease protein